MNKKYIVTGTGDLAVKIAEYLKKENVDVSVYEKKLSSHSTVENLCEAKNIPYMQFSTEQMTVQLLNDLNNYEVFLVSAINTYIFPKEVVEHTNFYGINYHNALLPRHKGMNAEAWAIYSEDEVTGITWHRIAERVDKGDVLLQKIIEIDEKTTSIRLLRQQMDAAYEGFLEISNAFLNKECIGEIQNHCEGEFHMISSVPIF